MISAGWPALFIVIRLERGEQIQFLTIMVVGLPASATVIHRRKGDFSVSFKILFLIGSAPVWPAMAAVMHRRKEDLQVRSNKFCLSL